MRLLIAAALLGTILTAETRADSESAIAWEPIELGEEASADASADDVEIELVGCQGDCGCTHAGCCAECWRWYDELTLFAGLDGSKQPQDFGVNANLGAQVHANWGAPLVERWGLGVQVGQGIVAHDNAVRVFEPVIGNKDRFQSFTTVGLFQRTDSGLEWGFAYDWLNQNSYDNFDLRQWRVRIAKNVTACDQLAVTGNLTGGDDVGNAGPVTVRLEAIDQLNVSWRHWWPTGVQTTAWGGIAEGHSEANLALGDPPAFGESFLMGADILAPLNNYLALYGETNLIFPADSGTVDAFFGVQFYPGGGAKCARRGRYSPLLPVASPTSFSTNLTR